VVSTVSGALGRRALALGICLVVLGGCGLHYWSRPGGTADDFNRDSAACAKEASPQYGILIQDTYRACLRARGWTRAQHHEPVPAGWFRGIE
jgi:8-oxo-dGTP pyrophosphatase MutT (NUDIX family)